MTPDLPEDNEIRLYSNQLRDDLKVTLTAAMDRAQHSVHVTMYGVRDKHMITKLQEVAVRGIDVSVVTDGSCTAAFGDDVKVSYRSGPGLMHRKIVVIDDEEVWLGSANLTTESLRLHGNLIMGLKSRALASSLLGRSDARTFTVGDQTLELSLLPEDNGLPQLVAHLDTARKSVRVAMFTFTHPTLTDALIRAHRRGAAVTVVADRSAGHGASAKALEQLRMGGVTVALSETLGLLHHKFCLIDNEVLIHGSANWTRAAFTKNDDLFVVLSPLTDSQVKQLDSLWRVIWAQSQ